MMKKNIYILALLMMPLVMFAQGRFRLQEKSGAKPSWINDGNSVNYIIYQNLEAPTLEEAENAALSYILNEMAMSVAVDVSANLDVTEETDFINNKNIQIQESKISLKVKKMPAIQGVSLAKAEKYWERYYNKKTKATRYSFYVRYPFSSIDRARLIDEYNAQEAEINNKIDALRDGIDEVSTMEDVKEAIDNLRLLKKEIGEDDSRIFEINQHIATYNKIFENVNVEIVEKDYSHIKFYFTYNGKVMDTKNLPYGRSNCASKFATTSSDGYFVIQFDTFNCYAQDDNYVEICLKTTSGKIIKKKIFLN